MLRSAVGIADDDAGRRRRHCVESEFPVRLTSWCLKKNDIKNWKILSDREKLLLFAKIGPWSVYVALGLKGVLPEDVGDPLRTPTKSFPEEIHPDFRQRRQRFNGKLLVFIR